jgi:hypothetical protein
MMRYLWVAVAVAFVGANASDNPFDLNVNLKKIDQDQDALLSELRVMAQKKEEKEEKTAQIIESHDATPAKIEPKPIEKVQSVSIETEEERLQRIKKEQAVIETQRAKKDKVEKDRLAAEKLEVEKYEAQRAEKKRLEEQKLADLEAKKVELENKKKAQEKQKIAESEEVDINITREDIEATKEADRAYQEAIAEVDNGN